MTHKIAGFIASMLQKSKVIEDDDSIFYQYGFEILIDTVLQTILLLIIGILLGKPMETLVFLIIFTLIRRYSGGYHANSKLKCTLVSTFVMLISIGLPIFFSNTISYIVGAVLAIITIWVFAPVEHPNRPLTDNAIRHCRIYSRVLTVLTGIVILVLNIYKPEYAYTASLSLFSVAILIIVQRGENKNERTESNEVS